MLNRIPYGEFIRQLRMPPTEKDRELAKEIVALLCEKRCTHPEAIRILNFTRDCIERSIVSENQER